MPMLTGPGRILVQDGGACILVTIVGGGKRFRGSMRGDVPKSRCEGGGVGDYTNNSAELSSAVQVLIWCISIVCNLCEVYTACLEEIEICYDNVLVEMVGNDAATFRSNRGIASLLSMLVSI